MNNCASVPAGRVLLTGYVDMTKIRVGNAERLPAAAIARARQRHEACGGNQPYPCPMGEWQADDCFVIHHGREDYVASMILGRETMLVAWVGNTDGRAIDASGS